VVSLQLKIWVSFTNSTISSRAGYTQGETADASLITKVEPNLSGEMGSL